jgi:hypothetical protein
MLAAWFWPGIGGLGLDVEGNNPSQGHMGWVGAIGGGGGGGARKANTHNGLIRTLHSTNNSRCEVRGSGITSSNFTGLGAYDVQYTHFC